MMRLLLALWALIAIRWDPPEPAVYINFVYACLGLYFAYGLACWIVSRTTTRSFHPLLEHSHWVDLVTFAVLMAFSGGASSIFFIGFFFPIIVTAFRRGRWSGLRVTLTSVAVFTSVGYLTSRPESFELNRFLLRPGYLLVIGYVVCHWGGFHFTLVRRFALLREVTALSNPRFGIDRTIGTVLDLLCRFYEADTCVLLSPIPDTDKVSLRRSARSDPDTLSSATQVPAMSIAPLLAFEESDAVIVRIKGGTSVTQRTSAGDGRAVTASDTLVQTAEVLGAPLFATVPWPQRGSGKGRLFVAFKDVRRFEQSELDFLAHVVAQVIPTLENVRLVDRLASDAADAERSRIARDLHDSVVQPYIGIRMALAAIREKLCRNQDAIPDIDHLHDIVGLEVHELREYVSGLKTPGKSRGILTDALKRYAERFTAATGIAVDIDIPPGLHLNDRLAAETFQLIVEALSNVRRHTESPRARVAVSIDHNHLSIEIDDEGTPEKPAAAASFTPKSITERTVALGGHVRVGANAGGGTTLTLRIPL